MIKATPEHCATLKKLQADRDELAFMLGVVVAEFEDVKKFYLEKIKESKDRQATVGNEILKSLGLDPNGGDYTINELDDGVVKKLVDGKYVDVGD